MISPSCRIESGTAHLGLLWPADRLKAFVVDAAGDEIKGAYDISEAEAQRLTHTYSNASGARTGSTNRLST
jgi:hypothetical protein